MRPLRQEETGRHPAPQDEGPLRMVPRLRQGRQGRREAQEERDVRPLSGRETDLDGEE